MRHLKGYKKLGRESAHRRAMLRNLATDLLTEGRIQTTLARAKAVRPIAEKMITLGRRGDLHARRQVASYLFGADATRKVFSELAERFQERAGGYTRIVKFGPRKGDAAEICSLELVDFHEKEGQLKKAARIELLTQKSEEEEEEAQEA